MRGLDGRAGKPERPPSGIASDAAGGGETDLAVELLDLLRKPLLDHPTLELERRRHLTLLGAELTRDDREPLDLLVSRELAVDVVDDVLDECLRASHAVSGFQVVLVERD